MKTKKMFIVLAFTGLVAGTHAQQWNLNGNAGTDPATNYIGTSDGRSVVFRINNTLSGSLNFGSTSFGYGTMPVGGNNNSAFGVDALHNNGASIYNSAFGTSSLYSNTTGSYNTALGVFAMKNNTTGTNNIALGYHSLSSNQAGEGNIAIGFQSFTNGVSGSSNISIGYRAFMNSNASGNIGVGGGVFSNLTDPATFNVAVGAEAGFYLTTGNYNSFFGRSSGRGSINNNTGTGNSFFGYDSGISISSGNMNSFFGKAAGENVTSGGYNSFFGLGSGTGITTGAGNTFIGPVTVPSSAKTATSSGFDTNYSIILASGNSTQRLYIHDNGFTGIGLGNNVIPKNTLEIKSLGGSPSTSGLRFTNLTSASTSIENPTNRVLSVNATGDVILVDDKQGTGTGGGATTNVLTSSVNTMTGTVNGIVASAPIVNSVTNTIANNQLTTTVNGVSGIVNLPVYSDVDTDQQTLSISGNTLSISNGNSVLLPVSNGGGSDINIYKDNGTITPADGVRTVLMNNNNLVFDTTGSSTNGRVYIGNSAVFPTITGNYRLNVEGGILTEKVKVALRSSATNWADYVFADNYKLMPLKEVEAFVKENKHLPGVASAENLTKEGLDLGQMQAKQMEKIEELTLYAIEQNKQIEKQKEQLEKQNKEIEELKAMVNALVKKNK